MVQGRQAEDIFHRIARYTRFVLFGKWALGAVAALILLVIFLMPLLDRSKGGARLSFVSMQPQGKGGFPVMMSPKLQGVTQHNEPFTITADKAEQRDANTVYLARVQGDFFQGAGNWAGLTANEGLYDMQKEFLVLQGAVALYREDGYSFSTERVDIDTARAIARGEGKVSGQGPLGNLEATGYEIEGNGERLRFGGMVPGSERVRVRIVK